MSDPKKKRYRILGGDLDGEIWEPDNEPTDADLEGLREASKANRVELMQEDDPGDERNTPLYDPDDQPEPEPEVFRDEPADQPRVPAPKEPRRIPPSVEIGPIEMSSPPMELDIGEAIVEPDEPDVVDVGEDEPDYSWLDSAESALSPLGDALGDADREVAGTLDAFSRGFNKSMLMGGSDELVSGLNAATGGDLEGTLARERAADEYAGNARPITTGIGRGLGFLPGMLAAPATVAGRVGMSMLTGGAEGALTSDSDDLQQTIGDASKGSLLGGLLGAGAEGLAKLAPLLRRWGVGQRRMSAAPGTAEELEAFADTKGVDYMERGLDERFDDLGLASGMKPQSAADVARHIGPPRGKPGEPGELQAAGQRMGDAIDQAGAQGARGDWANVDKELTNRSTRVLNSMPGAGPDPVPAVQQAIELQNLRAELPQPRTYQPSPSQPPVQIPVPPALPRHLQHKKAAWQKAGKMPKGVPLPSPDARQAQAYRRGAGAVAEELDSAMQSAGPELHSEWFNNKEAYEDLASFGDMATSQAARVKAQPMYKDAALYGSAVPGAASGYALSEQLGLGPWGAIPGAIAGGLVGGTIGKKYGRDMAGQGLMGLGIAATELAGPMRAVAGRVGPHTTLDEPNVTEAALSAIQSNPEALGGYSQRFREAAASPDPSAASALILELVQTDPDFRTYVLPMLRAGAVQQR